MSNKILKNVLKIKKNAEDAARKALVDKGKHPHLKKGKKRVKRDWGDLRLKDRKKGMTERFLEDHGYSHSDTPGKPNTYTYSGEGKVKAYTPFDGNKSGVEVKTFNNPTLKQLRTWMQY